MILPKLALVILAVAGCTGVAARQGTVVGPELGDATDVSAGFAEITVVPANPSTACSVEPGAWQAVYDTGPFQDVALAPDGRLAILQADGIRFYTTDGHPNGDALALGGEPTRLSALAPVATGGWLLREGAWYGSDVWKSVTGASPVRILRVSAEGKLLWQVTPDATFRPASALPLPDGGAWVAGAAGVVGELRRLAADGQLVQTLAWPEVVMVHAAVLRPDGSLCAAGETQVPPTPDDALVLRCWSPTGEPFWTWQEPVPKYGLAVRLDAWPDSRLLVFVDSHLYYSVYAAFAVDPPDSITTALASAFYPEGGNVSWGGELLAAALPDPDGSLLVVRGVETAAYMGIDKSATIVELYGKDAKAAGKVTLDAYQADQEGRVLVPGLGARPHAAIRMPDGGTLVVGEARKAFFSFTETGKGWLYRLPPVKCQ